MGLVYVFELRVNDELDLWRFLTWNERSCIILSESRGLLNSWVTYSFKQDVTQHLLLDGLPKVALNELFLLVSVEVAKVRNARWSVLGNGSGVL